MYDKSKKLKCKRKVSLLTSPNCWTNQFKSSMEKLHICSNSHIFSSRRGWSWKFGVQKSKKSKYQNVTFLVGRKPVTSTFTLISQSKFQLNQNFWTETLIYFVLLNNRDMLWSRIVHNKKTHHRWKTSSLNWKNISSVYLLIYQMPFSAVSCCHI